MNKFFESKKVFFLSVCILILIVLLRITLPIVFREEGVVTEILERCEGVEYKNVSVGSECPCKIIVEYRDKDEVNTTFGEMRPCGSFFGKYYKVGDSVNVKISFIPTIGMLNYVLIVSLVITFILLMFQRRNSLSKSKH